MKSNIKRHEISKDCLSCGYSMSTDDEDGNMIIVCSKDKEPYPVVPEDGYCEDWHDQEFKHGKI